MKGLKISLGIAWVSCMDKYQVLNNFSEGPQGFSRVRLALTYGQASGFKQFQWRSQGFSRDRLSLVYGQASGFKPVNSNDVADAKRGKFPVHSPHDIQSHPVAPSTTSMSLLLTQTYVPLQKQLCFCAAGMPKSTFRLTAQQDNGVIHGHTPDRSVRISRAGHGALREHLVTPAVRAGFWPQNSLN